MHGQLLNNDIPLMEPGHFLLIGMLVQASTFVCLFICFSLSTETGLIFKSNFLCQVALLQILFSLDSTNIEIKENNFQLTLFIFH